MDMVLTRNIEFRAMKESTTSHRFVIWDTSEIEPKPIPVQKEYDIWIGYYHHGTGYDGSYKPQKVDTIKATTFRIACYLYELENTAKSIRERMLDPNSYIEDTHFGTLYYNPDTNGNSWLGKYFETEEEAWETFSDEIQERNNPNFYK